MLPRHPSYARSNDNLILDQGQQKDRRWTRCDTAYVLDLIGNTDGRARLSQNRRIRSASSRVASLNSM